VTANNQLREIFKQKARKHRVQLLIPEKKHSTDNAVMTAIAGCFNFRQGKKTVKKIEANANLRLK
jgi:tRNA A37 threonylcarbamoyltransferase TsaD